MGVTSLTNAANEGTLWPNEGTLCPGVASLVKVA